MKFHFIALAAVAALCFTGCGNPSDWKAKKLVLSKFPGATIENSFISSDGKNLCGEARTDGLPARIFHAATDGKNMSTLGDTESDFQIFLNKCGVDKESNEEMRLRMRWAELDSAWRKRIEAEPQFVSSKSSDLDQNCDAKKEAGLRYVGDNLKLPPISERKILGTWLNKDSKLVVSLEVVDGKVYQVLRSRYCGSGVDGELMEEAPGQTYRFLDSSHGDYYRIEPTGDLGVYDKSGYIDSYAKRTKLYAD